MKKIDVFVNAAELATWLGISVPAVSSYARKGVVARGPVRGQYSLKKSVTAYVDHMRSAAAGREDDLTARERTRLLKAQADAAEGKAKKLANQYLEAAAVEKTWAAMRRRVLQILGGIPEEVGRRLPHLTPHDLAEIAGEVTLATAPLNEPKATDG